MTESIVNIFTEISHADRGTINMKHIEHDFRLKAWFRPPGGGNQNSTFEKMVMLYIKLKGMMRAATW